jgi:hypothetical protein
MAKKKAKSKAKTFQLSVTEEVASELWKRGAKLQMTPSQLLKSAVTTLVVGGKCRDDDMAVLRVFLGATVAEEVCYTPVAVPAEMQVVTAPVEDIRGLEATEQLCDGEELAEKKIRLKTVYTRDPGSVRAKEFRTRVAIAEALERFNGPDPTAAEMCKKSDDIGGKVPTEVRIAEIAKQINEESNRKDLEESEKEDPEQSKAIVENCDTRTPRAPTPKKSIAERLMGGPAIDPGVLDAIAKDEEVRLENKAYINDLIEDSRIRTEASCFVRTSPCPHDEWDPTVSPEDLKRVAKDPRFQRPIGEAWVYTREEPESTPAAPTTEESAEF